MVTVFAIGLTGECHVYWPQARKSTGIARTRIGGIMTITNRHRHTFEITGVSPHIDFDYMAMDIRCPACDRDWVGVMAIDFSITNHGFTDSDKQQFGRLARCAYIAIKAAQATS